MPKVNQSDDDLGCGSLLRILPDTWNNISWVIQNSIEQLIQQSLSQRRMIEEVKQYAIQANINNYEMTVEVHEKAEIGIGRVKKELDALEDQLMRKTKEIKLEIQRNKDNLDGKLERINFEISGRVSRIEEKVAQVETKEVMDQIINEKIEDAKEDLNARVTKIKQTSDKRFDEIFNEHLYYEPIIGPGPQNEFHTISAYVANRIPDLMKKSKRNEDNTGQAMFMLKNFQSKVNKAIQNEIPDQFKSQTYKIEQAKNHMNNFEKQ